MRDDAEKRPPSSAPTNFSAQRLAAFGRPGKRRHRPLWGRYSSLPPFAFWVVCGLAACGMRGAGGQVRRARFRDQFLEEIQDLHSVKSVCETGLWWAPSATMARNVPRPACARYPATPQKSLGPAGEGLPRRRRVKSGPTPCLSRFEGGLDQRQPLIASARH